MIRGIGFPDAGRSTRCVLIYMLLIIGSARDLRQLMMIYAAAAPENLLQNGSFEEGVDPTQLTLLLPVADNITGWFVLNGSVSLARLEFQEASDCSPTHIGLSTSTITTSFRANAHTDYSVLLDSAANADAGYSVVANFSLSVLESNSTVLNSSVTSVNGTGYDAHNLGWRTTSLFFTTSAAAASITINLTLMSNIIGIYGAIIDNVRVYEGSVFPPEGLESDASCKSVKPEGTSLAVIIAVPAVSVIALCFILFWWRQRKVRASRGVKAILRMEGEAQVFPYKVLQTATRNFNPEHRLGEGGFGTVFKGVLLDGTEVAVKKLSAKSHQGQEEFANEVTLISRVQHRNLVTLKGCCMEGNERILVYEFLENKSLSQALLDPKQAVDLDWPTRFKISVGTARGLAYLHQDSQPRILHRDIKASNILLDKNFEAKIADFGLAKFFPDGVTHVSTRVAGTVGYLAPEYALRGLLTDKADVFSFGIVALELVSGRPNLNFKVPEDEQYLLDWVGNAANDCNLYQALAQTMRDNLG